MSIKLRVRYFVMVDSQIYRKINTVSVVFSRMQSFSQPIALIATHSYFWIIIISIFFYLFLTRFEVFFKWSDNEGDIENVEFKVLEGKDLQKKMFVQTPPGCMACVVQGSSYRV